MHDFDNSHSEFVTHSGRQFGGEPMWLGKHEQIAWLSFTRHCELAPQGDGTHGFTIAILNEIYEVLSYENKLLSSGEQTFCRGIFV